MPTFPIPVFVACVLAVASLRLWHQQERLSPFVLLLMLCASQTLIIALAQHYGVTGMRQIQPLFASLIPPAAWFAFRGRIRRGDLLHALGPVTVLLALLTTPPFVDVLLPGLFALYGACILYHAKDGADTQPHALLSSGDLPAKIWLVIGVALLASALSDVLIVIAQMSGYSAMRPWIISVFSVGNLLIIGVFSFSPHVQTHGDDEQTDAPAPPEADPGIWAHVQTFMADKRPYLDPDLTLSRLSRQLGIPAKVLSSTINRATGENVSRFINQARIEAAQHAMLEGETITNAMLLCGFNTKSNFNREFLRITGMSPTNWVRKAREDYETEALTADPS